MSLTGAALGALACIILLAYWLAERHLEARRRVLGCTHDRLEVRQVRKEYGGTLYLQCAKRDGGCGYQAHLLCLRPLPGGVWHLEEGADDLEKMRCWAEAWHRQAGLCHEEHEAAKRAERQEGLRELADASDARVRRRAHTRASAKRGLL